MDASTDFEPWEIDQNFFDRYTKPMICNMVKINDLTEDGVEEFAPAPAQKGTFASVGIAPSYSEQGYIIVLSITINKGGKDKVLLVLFSDPRRNRRTTPNANAQANEERAIKLLEERILCREDVNLYAFNMAPLVLALHQKNIHVTNAVDIQSACPDERTLHPFWSIQFAVGESFTYHEFNIRHAFDDVDYDPYIHTGTIGRKKKTEVALRSWIAFYISSVSADMESLLAGVAKIHTKDFGVQKLDILSEISRAPLRLAQAQTTITTQKVDNYRYGMRDNKIDTKQEKFTERLRKSKNQTYRIETSDGYSVAASMASAKGRSAALNVATNLSGTTLTRLRKIGRDDPTSAEYERNLILLKILQGKEAVLDQNPFIQNIWFATNELTWPDDHPLPSNPAVPILEPEFFTRSPNNSQMRAINSMLSDSNDTRITIIQGPPGTGKTSVIANFVHAAVHHQHKGIWLAAQSNAAVRNIAEKLVNEKFFNFRLIVSSDFYDEWHEGLYMGDLSSFVILSGNFGRPKLSTPPPNCQVILCTISMLSNARLRSHTIMNQIPLATLVIDEASQIEIGHYMSIFTEFARTLGKVCFIGDDKQLPPYGENDDETKMQSIFEVAHLRPTTILLDTQYRMPPYFGRFISEQIYDNRLDSFPGHKIKDDNQCCYLVDADDGSEEKSGTSYINDFETKVVTRIATHLEDQGYDYCIITPYDAQRNLIEKKLKEAELDWESKTFNVDPFQGNEKDFIILSLVRTVSLGFLKDLRRSNVMLTRFKQKMFVVGKKAFLEDKAVDSLVGKLVEYCGEDGWLLPEDLEDV